MDTLCRLTVWRGTSSGFIAMFSHNGVPIHSMVCGYEDIASGRPMTLDTEMRIASMAKPITAVAAMSLVEEGRLGLDDRVSGYLPAFSTSLLATDNERDASGEFPTRPASNPMLVRHLLMFASGVGPGREKDSALVDYWNASGIYRQPSGDLTSRVTALSSLPLLEEPGTNVDPVFSGSKYTMPGKSNIFVPSSDVLFKRVTCCLKMPAHGKALTGRVTGANTRLSF